MLAQVQRKGLLFRQQKVFVGENTSLEGEKCVSSVQSLFKLGNQGVKRFPRVQMHTGAFLLKPHQGKRLQPRSV